MEGKIGNHRPLERVLIPDLVFGEAPIYARMSFAAECRLPISDQWGGWWCCLWKMVSYAER